MRNKKCVICGKMFGGGGGLAQHKKAVHNVTGLRAESISRKLNKALSGQLESSKNLDHANKNAEDNVGFKHNEDWRMRRAELERILREANSSRVPKYNKPPDNRPKKSVSIIELKPLVRLIGNPRLAWTPVRHEKNFLLDFDGELGKKINISQVDNSVDREVVLGVDFGTSCTKVVLGDPAMNAAYAVPFTQMAGVSAYLLPTQLGESNGIYSLKVEGTVHNDLKLAMLSDPSDAGSCARVSAYLALVIRTARAWIFTELRDQYLTADLLWSLALGQPADQATSKGSLALFKKLGEVAWFLANYSGVLTPRLCLDSWRQFDSGAIDAGDIEVLVMPELAAQIHGFVSSTEFDPKNSNIYLLVDVGAGTVDASVFKVRNTPGGKTSFNFFTNSVEAYGTMNLHRHRIGWWQSQLNSEDRFRKIVDDLEGIRLPTEYKGALPATYLDYIDGMEVTLEGGAVSPDQAFFKLIRNQVAGEVLFGAKKKNLLDSRSINGMPFFLCGGGSRYGFYKQLITEMKKQAGCSWLNALHRELTLPRILRADGVNRMDFDRLSVAYGLSQLRLDTVSQVEAMQPSVPTVHASNWKSNYVGKDAC